MDDILDRFLVIFSNLLQHILAIICNSVTLVVYRIFIQWRFNEAITTVLRSASGKRILATAGLRQVFVKSSSSLRQVFVKSLSSLCQFFVKSSLNLSLILISLLAIALPNPFIAICL